ncbi:MAG TPA: hypothetical protein VGF42_07600 [Caulobacteraceae bacterium]|jgi:hypothetical protein
MNDRPKEPAAETPMQRALRLKKAALEAASQSPARADRPLRPTAGMAAGASKPRSRK